MHKQLQKKTGSCDTDQVIYENLSHLITRDAEVGKKIIRYHPEVITDSFEDFRPSKLSITHFFDLTSENTIFQMARIISPSNNETVRKEILRMLLAGIITPVQLSWTSLVVIASKRRILKVLCQLLKVEFSHG